MNGLEQTTTGRTKASGVGAEDLPTYDQAVSQIINSKIELQAKLGAMKAEPLRLWR